jgi:hypothetical protein
MAFWEGVGDPCDRDGIDDRGWWWCLRVLEESDRGAEMTDNLLGRCLVRCVTVFGDSRLCW